MVGQQDISKVMYRFLINFYLKSLSTTQMPLIFCSDLYHDPDFQNSSLLEPISVVYINKSSEIHSSVPKMQKAYFKQRISKHILTVIFQFITTKFSRTNELPLHLALIIDKDRRQIPVWIVRNARCWYRLQDFELLKK